MLFGYHRFAVRKWIRAVVGLSAVAAMALSIEAADPPSKPVDDGNPLRVLMLGGSQGSHRPAEMAGLLTPALARRGITVEYTEDVARLSAAELARFDCVAIFRDFGEMTPEQEAALVGAIEAGKGLVAIHCASHCFRGSDRYTRLVGGRFHHHAGEPFRARIVDAQHPALRDVASFESWDETYVHDQLAGGSQILMARPEAGGYEPYTWVRTAGKGRVFYTALGHDERTWSLPAFHRLIEQGILWSTRRANDDVAQPPYFDSGADLPNYLAGEKWGTEGDRTRQMPKPLSPDESIRHMHLPEGFRAELFAAEPDLVKPIAFNFDERGRLWVVETLDYPNDLLANPVREGRDRIKICEDTDGDGRADKFTVFAEDLNIPTGILPCQGGCLLALAPHLVYLKDTDNDGRADEREIVYTGFGRRDTHAVHSNLRWGLDNYVWATVGYSGGTIKVGDSEQNLRQGIFRFLSDGSELEFLTQTSNNTWGLGLSEEGDIFASTANNDHSVYLALPNRYFEGVRGWHGQGSAGIADHLEYRPIAPDVRQMDWHGRFTAACGHALYTARAFPEEYWNRAAFVCEPTGHLIHLDWLVPNGSSFTARDGFNFFASTDPWTAPIMAEVGPDGALWIADWYNYIVQHNPTPHGFETGPGNAYVTPLRDKDHGRIYRIVHKDAAPAPKPMRLDGATTAELVAALGSDNQWWRLTAQRILVGEKRTDAIPALLDLATAGKNDLAAAHALYALDGLGAFSTENRAAHRSVLREALKNKSPAVVRAALSVMPRDAEATAAVLASNGLATSDPRVRLACLLALAEMPGSPQAATAIVAALGDEANAADRWIPSAATSAAARSDLDFLIAAATRSPAPQDSTALATTVRVVAEHFARGAPQDSIDRLVTALAANGSNAELAATVLEGLVAGWPDDVVPTNKALLADQLGALIERVPPTSQSQVIQLATRWGAAEGLADRVRGLRDALLAKVADSSATDEARAAAATQLASLVPTAETFGSLLELLTLQTSPEFSTALLEALAASSSPELGTAITSHIEHFGPATRKRAVAILLQRREWTAALLAALDDGQIAAVDLALDQEQRLRHHPDDKLAARAAELLARGAKEPSADRKAVLESMLPLAAKSGDAAHGREVFEKNCSKCHRHGALGANIGPDLTGVAARPRGEILTEMLDPSRSVEGNYRQYIVSTTDGRVLSGLLLAETRTAVELLDSEAKKHLVLREEIDEMAASPLSVMPAGFEKLPEQDIVDLLSFLTARGKYLPLPLGRAATVASTLGMFNSKDQQVERLVFDTWGPHTFADVPFQLLDPRDGAVPNAIALQCDYGNVSRTMPRSVTLPCQSTAAMIHLLGGVSGWGFPLGEKGTVSLIVRLHYDDGMHEDHPLRNGIHMADYIRRVDVPESQFAFDLAGRQIRYLAIRPARQSVIERIEFVKGDDATSPVVMAVTLERSE